MRGRRTRHATARGPLRAHRRARRRAQRLPTGQRADAAGQRARARATVPVSADLFAVLSASQRLAERTGGAFDVTQRRADAVVARRAAAQRAAGAAHGSRLRAGRRIPASARSMPRAHRARCASGHVARCRRHRQRLRGRRSPRRARGARGLPRALAALGGDIAVGDTPPGPSRLVGRDRTAARRGRARARAAGADARRGVDRGRRRAVDDRRRRRATRTSSIHVPDGR